MRSFEGKESLSSEDPGLAFQSTRAKCRGVKIPVNQKSSKKKNTLTENIWKKYFTKGGAKPHLLTGSGGGVLSGILTEGRKASIKVWRPQKWDHQSPGLLKKGKR